ncbi:MAG TPA: NADH-quinone oxidoreductase subunit M [Cyclobacteriaceae bacterium]|nr:NADH-quinone oxidoreductase subunit M [Cyclobacteriaceae bacterium]
MIILLLIIPLLTSLVVVLLSPEKARNAALASSMVNLLLTLGMLVGQDGTSATVDVQWIPSLGIRFSLAMDGISFLMVLLTNLMMPFIIGSTDIDKNYPSSFYSLLLFMQMGLLGVFTAQDGFLFYVFWELTLIPIWFICLIWGGENRAEITLKFFLYTLTGSLLMLVALIDVYLNTPGNHSFQLADLITAGARLDEVEQGLIFWALFLAFAIKIPIFPFHSWQPDTYSSAPTTGTMMLSALMLKMGTYGLIRWLLPLVPVGVQMWGNVAMVMAVIGILYAAGLALTQKEFKRLLAYSSMSHVGLIAAGSLTVSTMGIQGAVFQMFSHGLIVFGLFYVVHLISKRASFKTLQDLGGLRNTAPQLATSFLLLILGSIALPLTSGFVGEYLLISALVKHNFWIGAAAGISIILGAVYMLRTFQITMSGDVTSVAQHFSDLTTSEKLILYPVIGLILLLGVFPAPLLSITESVANQIVVQSGNLINLTP